MSATTTTSSSNRKDTLTILYFATAASYTRRQQDTLPLPATSSNSSPLTLRKVLQLLEEKYPGINAKVLGSCAVTVDLDYVDLEDEGPEGLGKVIEAGAEVGIIPPVSSG